MLWCFFRKKFWVLKADDSDRQELKKAVNFGKGGLS